MPTNIAFLTAVLEGRYLDSYLSEAGRDAPKFTPEDMKFIGSPLDFVGLNIYTPTYVRAADGPHGFAVIKPPADLRPLCPENQPGHPTGPAPGWSVDAVLNARSPAAYLWDADAWYRHDAHPGINAYNNHLAMQFALVLPPALVKSPPTNKLLAQTAKARTVPFTPAPTLIQLVPSNRAR